MKRLLLVVYIFIVVFSSSIAYSQRMNFNWLVGTWKYNTGRGYVIESWQKINDSVYQGKSVLAREKDTILQEQIEIIRSVSSDTAWYYIPTVKNQNDNKPVPFKIIFQRGLEFISENKAHDFPQRISYRRYLPQYMHASIEGIRNGNYNKQNFSFYLEEVQNLFTYTLSPLSNTHSLHDTVTTATIIKHNRYIDSLALKNHIVLGGSEGTSETTHGEEFILLKALNIEKAKSIMQNDPAVLTGIYKGEVKSYRMTAWYPGNWGRSSF